MKTRIQATIKILLHKRSFVKTFNEECRINNTIYSLQKQLLKLTDDEKDMETKVTLKLVA